MNLTSKKIFCYDCNRLVHCRLERDEDKIEYATCCRCNKRLQEKGVAVWKDLRKKKVEVFSEPILSPMMITELTKNKKKIRKEL